MRAISGRDASCRATSLPIPALAPVINADFTGVVLIVMAPLLVEVQPGLAERCGPAAGRIRRPGPARLRLARRSAVFLPRRPQAEIVPGMERSIHSMEHSMAWHDHFHR